MIAADGVRGVPLDQASQTEVNQLVLPFGAKYPQDYAGYNKSGLGGSYPLRNSGEEWWQTRNNWQRWQVENTRLGIPTSFIDETLHSGGSGGTNFPMPCLQGTFSFSRYAWPLRIVWAMSLARFGSWVQGVRTPHLSFFGKRVSIAPPAVSHRRCGLQGVSGKG